MSPFWASLFDQLKDCGRNATLFIITLACLFVLLMVVAMICVNGLQQYLIYALPLVILFLLRWSWNAVRRARRSRNDPSVNRPLSDHELRVARSKLTKKWQSRPGSQPPSGVKPIRAD